MFSSASPSAGAASSGQPLSKAAEAVIKRSLLVGNFEAAVQCCMSTGNMADAMLLARCGAVRSLGRFVSFRFASFCFVLSASCSFGRLETPHRTSPRMNKSRDLEVACFSSHRVCCCFEVDWV